MDSLYELRPRWYVMVGNCYIAGLGQTFAGYQNKSGIPQTPGFVVTLLERRAMMFTSRRDASKLAQSLGGHAIRVSLTQEEEPPPLQRETAPETINRLNSNERS